MLLTLLERLASRRRRPGASPVWTVIAVTTFLVRRSQQRARKDEVALREVLQPGEALLITHTTQPRG